MSYEYVVFGAVIDEYDKNIVSDANRRLAPTHDSEADATDVYTQQLAPANSTLRQFSITAAALGSGASGASSESKPRRSRPRDPPGRENLGTR